MAYSELYQGFTEGYERVGVDRFCRPRKQSGQRRVDTERSRRAVRGAEPKWSDIPQLLASFPRLRGANSPCTALIRRENKGEGGIYMYMLYIPYVYMKRERERMASDA